MDSSQPEYLSPVAYEKTEISMDSSQPEYVPHDIVFEIIARTSVQTLDTCKVVCKEWKQLLSHSTLMASNSEISGNLYGYMVQFLVSGKHVHRFVPLFKSERTFNFSPFKFDDLKIEASSPQGIFCSVRSMDRDCRYYVSKPCTNQWQALPNPRHPHPYWTQKVALVVMSSTPVLRYKIIRISRHPQLDRDLCQMFDSKTWAWKKTEDHVLLSSENLFDDNPAIYANDLVCFLTRDYVLAFYLHQETPFLISLPQSPCESNRELKRMGKYQGKLGLMTFTRETSWNIDLWVLRDRKNGRWEIISRLNIGVLAAAYHSVRFITPLRTYLGLLSDTQDVSFEDSQLWDIIMYTNSILPNMFSFRSDREPVILRERSFPPALHSKKPKKFTRIDQWSLKSKVW